VDVLGLVVCNGLVVVGGKVDRTIGNDLLGGDVVVVRVVVLVGVVRGVVVLDILVGVVR
jgi:hypothetical protein